MGKTFNYPKFPNSTAAGIGPTIEQELADVKICEGDWASQCRMNFDTYAVNLYCRSRMEPAFCSTVCPNAAMRECIDEPWRNAINQRCLREAFADYSALYPCCSAMQLDLFNGTLVQKTMHDAGH